MEHTYIHLLRRVGTTHFREDLISYSISALEGSTISSVGRVPDS